MTLYKRVNFKNLSTHIISLLKLFLFSCFIEKILLYKNLLIDQNKVIKLFLVLGDY